MKIYLIAITILSKKEQWKKKEKIQKPKKSAQILTVSKNDWSEKWSSRCYLTINEWGWVSDEELWRSRRVLYGLDG